MSASCNNKGKGGSAACCGPALFSWLEFKGAEESRADKIAWAWQV